MNVWAQYYDGTNFASKKAFREAMKNEPENVTFTGTSIFDPDTQFSGVECRNHEPLIVVGPDPYRNRKWYANVKCGKVT